MARALAADRRIVDMGEHRGLARVVGFTSELHVHLEHAPVELLHQLDGFFRRELKGFEKRSDLRQDALECRQGLALLSFLLPHPMLFLVRLAIPPVAVAPVIAAIGVATFSLAHGSVVPVASR